MCSSDLSVPSCQVAERHGAAEFAAGLVADPVVVGAGAAAGVESRYGLAPQMHDLGKLVGHEASGPSGGRFQGQTVVGRLVQGTKVGVGLVGEVTAHGVGERELAPAKVFVFPGREGPRLDLRSRRNHDSRFRLEKKKILTLSSC